jgi:hypothetical protein
MRYAISQVEEGSIISLQTLPVRGEQISKCPWKVQNAYAP